MSYVTLYRKRLNSHIQLCKGHRCKHTYNMILTTSQSVNHTIVMPNSKINCGFSSSGKLYSIDWKLGYLCFETIYQSHFQGSSSPSTINSTPKRLTTNLMVREQEGQNTSNGRVFTLKHYISAIPWAWTHLFTKFQGVLENEIATRLKEEKVTYQFVGY